MGATPSIAENGEPASGSAVGVGPYRRGGWVRAPLRSPGRPRRRSSRPGGCTGSRSALLWVSYPRGQGGGSVGKGLQECNICHELYNGIVVGDCGSSDQEHRDARRKSRESGEDD